ncbi:hypothetical protein [Halomonas sp. YLGW01]|uniref:hypothetical protein n=1 Tax=Halomonas sp. YLGW01 TaxID=2773308 RepID=UPI0017821075|nr:hypothetical protein [Halomonas sp. YLGW01]
MRELLGKVTWIIGGGVLLGLGMGLFFLEHAGLAFLGALMSGLGAGLLFSAVMSRRSD